VDTQAAYACSSTRISTTLKRAAGKKHGEEKQDMGMIQDVLKTLIPSFERIQDTGSLQSDLILTADV
jgi:hypothetical protein